MGNVVNIKDGVPYDVYIGRKNGDLGGSVWANPYSVKEHGRGKCIEMYREHLKSNLDLLHILPSLKGKIMGCWCYPESCHGDVLDEYANHHEDVFKLVVSGSRGIPEDIAASIVDNYVSENLIPNHRKVIIIEGGARGVDRGAQRAGKDLGLDVLTVKAKWGVNGVFDRAAGHKRNNVMLELCDGLLAIWDGKSPGTNQAISRAEIKKIPCVTIISKL